MVLFIYENSALNVSEDGIDGVIHIVFTKYIVINDVLQEEITEHGNLNIYVCREMDYPIEHLPMNLSRRDHNL